MEKFKVSSLPLRDVISDIAEELGAPFTKHCGIFQVNIPERYGQGTITGTDFEGGMGLIRYDCLFEENIVIEYTLDRIHPVKFLFCLHGEISHNFMDEMEWHEIQQHKNAIVASSAHHGHRIRFRAGERAIFTSLEIERRSFQGKISCEPDTVAESWQDMLNDISAKNTFYHDGFYSLMLSDIFEQWDRYAGTGFLNKLYLEGMALQILVLQITQFQDDIKSEGKKTVLRKSELNQMVKAIKFIEDRLEDLPNIDAIAAEIGLNANKLQQGFKELYGKTVNLYIREKRLETARTLLLNTDYTLSIIASEVGYKSQSYLSKMFREAYGVQPSEFRRKRERKKILPDALLGGDGLYSRLDEISKLKK